MFDAVALILTEEGAERQAGEAAASDFVADAFAHCKFIAFNPRSDPADAKSRRRPRSR